MLMGALTKATRAVRDPVYAAVWLTGRFRPEILFRRYCRLARRQGLRGCRFVLSFDCDTEKDIEVVEEVHERLAVMGISPIYAVPGELLEHGAPVYRRIARCGAEFLNHGHTSHCRIDPKTGRYESSFFYDKLPRRTVLQDICRGHETVSRVLGRAPAGFRTPHFGTFQSRTELRFLHDTLQSLGYRYSTSSVPLKGLLGGPVQRIATDFWEIPVSGCFNFPLATLDSYGFRYAPGRVLGESDYERQFSRVLKFLSAGGRSGLLNVYADPSQVYDWPAFFTCMESAAPFAVDSYERVLQEVVS